MLEFTDKSSIKSMLGKQNIWKKKVLLNVKYNSGLYPFDDWEEEKKKFAVHNITLRPKGIEFAVSYMLKSQFIPILNSDIESIVLYTSDKEVKEKDKSVIKRAVVGGLLLGPVGAVVGGMSGIGKKEETIIPDHSLIFNYKDSNNEDNHIIYEVGEKRKKEVVNFFEAHLPDLFVVA